MTGAIPTLNMAGWSILDYELAYDGLVAVGHAANGVVCQPRSQHERNLHPGAAFVRDIAEDWIDWRASELVGHLGSMRFPDAEDDDRRVRLLLRHELDNPDLDVPALVALAREQSARLAI